MRRDLVFLHIPKTGGTSIRNALAETLADRQALFDYGPRSEATTPRVRELVYGEGGRAQGTVPPDFRRRVEDGRGLFVAGHFRARKYWDHFHAGSFVTILRDPVDRMISEYNHFVRHQGIASPIEEFVVRARPRILTNTFAGVDPAAFGFIGFTDRLESDAATLSALLGRPVSVPRDNEGTYDAALSERAADPAFRAWIAGQIADDLALYNRLRERFARPGAGASALVGAAAGGATDTAGAALRGRVRLTRSGAAVGYALDARREVIAEVEFVVAGAVVARAPADRFVPFLKASGRARSGVGGFVVPLRELLWRSRVPLSRTRVAVRFAGTATELAGSPLTLRGRLI
jgi:hypothetical protein